MAHKAPGRRSGKGCERVRDAKSPRAGGGPRRCCTAGRLSLMETATGFETAGMIRARTPCQTAWLPGQEFLGHCRIYFPNKTAPTVVLAGCVWMDCARTECRKTNSSASPMMSAASSTPTGRGHRDGDAMTILVGAVRQGRSLWPGLAVVAAAGVMGHGYCTALRACLAPLTDCRATASSLETAPVTGRFSRTWNARMAERVFGPRMPSTGPGS